MSAVEEHKPVEKRRALGRGLDSLLPSGPRMVPAAPTSAAGAATARTGMSEPHGAAVRPPVIPAAVPEIVPPTSSAVTGEIAEIHAGREKTPTRAGAPAPHEIVEIPLDLIDENPYQTRRTFDAAALNELAESIKANGLAQPVVVRAGTNGRYVLVLGERRCRASKLAGKASVAAIVRQLGNEQAAEMTIVKNLKAQVNLLQNPARYEAQPKDEKAVDPNVRDAERRLRESLGMRVRVMAYQGNKGQIVIRYESLADFDRVLERLAGDN